MHAIVRRLFRAKNRAKNRQKSKSAEKSSFDLAKAKVEDSDKREELLSKLAKLKGQQNKGNQGSGITKEAKSLENSSWQ